MGDTFRKNLIVKTDFQKKTKLTCIINFGQQTILKIGYLEKWGTCIQLTAPHALKSNVLLFSVFSILFYFLEGDEDEEEEYIYKGLHFERQHIASTTTCV